MREKFKEEKEMVKDMKRYFWNMGENRYVLTVILILMVWTLIFNIIPQIFGLFFVVIFFVYFPELFPNKHDKKVTNTRSKCDKK